MQPQLCSRCKKNVAVVFITRMENGKNINEGLCLKCAKNLGLPQVNEMMQRMGITDEDLDNISNEMMSAFGGAENLEGIDAPDGDDEEDGKTATFPFLGRLFGGQNGDAPLVQVAAEFGAKLVDVAELERPVRAPGHARRLPTALAQAVASVALAGHALLREELRMAVRARHHAHAAPDALALILDDRPVLGLVDGPRGAVLQADGIFAVVAAGGIAVPLHLGEPPHGVRVRLAVQRPHFEAILVLAHHLARTAADAARHVKVKSNSHDAPS